MAALRWLRLAIVPIAFLCFSAGVQADCKDWPTQKLDPPASSCYSKCTYWFANVHTFLNRYRYPPIDIYPPGEPIPANYKIFSFRCPYVTPAELYSNPGIR